MASSKEVLVGRKTKQVEIQPEEETISQPETSQSAGNAWRPQLGGTVASSKKSKSAENRNRSNVSQKFETVSQSETSQSAGCALAVTIRWASGVVEESPSQPKTETSLK